MHFCIPIKFIFSITLDQHPSIPRQVCRGRKLLSGMCWANVRVLSRENFTYVDRSLSGKIQQVSGNDFVSIELISCRESVLNKQYKSVKIVQQVNSIGPNRNYLQFLNRRTLWIYELFFFQMRICKYTNSNMLSNAGEFILWNVTHSLQEPFDVSIQCTFISFKACHNWITILYSKTWI